MEQSKIIDTLETYHRAGRGEEGAGSPVGACLSGWSMQSRDWRSTTAVGWTSNSHCSRVLIKLIGRCVCVNLFFMKAYASTCSRRTSQPQICGKQRTTHLPLFLRIYRPFANSYDFLEPIFFLLALHPILWPRLKRIQNFAYFGAVNCF